MSGAILINPKPVVTGLVHITRSCCYKLNIGNYQSIDFFCSQTAECQASDVEEISEQVHDFCKKQVWKAVQEYERKHPKQAEAIRRTA